MGIEQSIKDVFTSLIPYISLGIAVVMLEFFFEYLFMIVDNMLKPTLRKFMYSKMRKIMQVLPRFDSFITFLVSLFIVAPVLTVLMRDILNPFLRSLTNNFLVMLAAPIVLLVIIYFAFETWYSKRFRNF